MAFRVVRDLQAFPVRAITTSAAIWNGGCCSSAMARIETQQETRRPNPEGQATDSGILESYARSAPNIDAYYPREFIRSLSSMIIDKLELRETDALVDLGCGAGVFTREIVDQVALRRPVLAVDPVREMLARIPKTRRIETIQEDAFAFSESPGAYTYSKVLIKDALYHVQRGTTLLANLHRDLPVGGIVLLVHASPFEEYPLFPGARSRWSVLHPEAEELMKLLTHVGFIADREEAEFRREIPGDRHLDMIRDRYFPGLSTFSDEEIEDGIRELAESTAMREPVVKLTERFDFVAATKI